MYYCVLIVVSVMYILLSVHFVFRGMRVMMFVFIVVS